MIGTGHVQVLPASIGRMRHSRARMRQNRAWMEG